jgi:hypothetical protein
MLSMLNQSIKLELLLNKDTLELVKIWLMPHHLTLELNLKRRLILLLFRHSKQTNQVELQERKIKERKVVNKPKTE